MPTLYIVRGPPGSGKTTLAQKLCPEHNFAADQWFALYNEGRFDPNGLVHAHAWCQARVRDAIKAGYDVAVHNTFSRLWEIEPYLECAAYYNCTVHVLIVDQQYQNQHSVPEKHIDQMAAKFEFNGRKLGS